MRDNPTSAVLLHPLSYTITLINSGLSGVCGPNLSGEDERQCDVINRRQIISKASTPVERRTAEMGLSLTSSPLSF